MLYVHDNRLTAATAVLSLSASAIGPIFAAELLVHAFFHLLPKGLGEIGCLIG